MAQRKRLKKKRVRRFNWGLLFFACIVAGMAVFALKKPPPPVSGPELDQVKDLADFKTFNKVNGGWIAVLSPLWPGNLDTTAADRLCVKLTERLRPSVGETVNLMSPDGEPLRNCQANR